MTHSYQIEPTAPLVFRSGRPFGTGSQESARFPWPSAMAGALRSAWMRSQGDVHFTRAADALNEWIAGPFLLGPDGELYVPKPIDAVVILDEASSARTVYRLLPGETPPGCGSNLPQGLSPVVAESEFVGKPQRSASFWPLTAILDWDLKGNPLPTELLKPESEPAPLRLRRQSTHLRLNRQRRAASEGQIFQLEALDFGCERGQNGFAPQAWSLAALSSVAIPEGVLQLGGERRGAWLSQLPDTHFAPPPELVSALSMAAEFALTLCTPALFADGWKPAWLDADLCGEIPDIPGLRVRLRAVASERWQGISGWDLASQSPKPARRVVPAGSTYWFQILTKPEDPAWAAALWLHRISDHAQDRRDGWGTVLPRRMPLLSQS